MHPGVGIIKVRQGLVEIILRLLITVSLANIKNIATLGSQTKGLGV